jgi:MOSC domain-containing protein YiiM
MSGVRLPNGGVRNDERSSEDLQPDPQSKTHSIDAELAGTVAAVSRSAKHGFSKQTQSFIKLVAGFGVEDDAHAGTTTQHLYLRRKDPTRTNLTQVHLVPAELFDELAVRGFTIAAGQMGENIATRGVNLTTLPAGARLSLGHEAVVEVTGLRDPCNQLNGLAPGLMKALLVKHPDGFVERRAGIMGIVVQSGIVKPGDTITIAMPPLPWREMGPD